MKGHQPIVLMLRNHGFHEHDTVRSARTEAERLTHEHGATTVVYVPVAIVEPPRDLTVRAVEIDRTQLMEADLHDADLPF